MFGFTETYVVAEAESGHWGYVHFTGPEGYEAVGGRIGWDQSWDRSTVAGLLSSRLVHELYIAHIL